MYVKSAECIEEENVNAKSIYPVLMSDRVAETARFYCDHFGFQKTFEEDWYVSLLHSGTKHELAILQYDHPSVPEGRRTPSKGVVINVEVANASQAYEHLVAKGLTVHCPLRDEEWGQRHFITEDPSGNLVDVIENIQAAQTFESSYITRPQ